MKLHTRHFLRCSPPSPLPPSPVAEGLPSHLLVPSRKLSMRVDRGTALGTGALLGEGESAAGGGGGAEEEAADKGGDAWLWNSATGRERAGRV